LGIPARTCVDLILLPPAATLVLATHHVIVGNISTTYLHAWKLV